MTMKLLRVSIILFISALCPMFAEADNVTSYLDEICLRDREVVRANREVELKMVVDLSKLSIRTQHTVTLTPVLVAADGSREAAFPSVVIDGKTRHKVYLRAKRLKSVDIPPYHYDNAQTIITRSNGKEQIYDYRAMMAYERWMLGGRIEIRERVTGCANCEKGSQEQLIPEASDALAPFAPVYLIDTMVPVPEAVKVRAETRTARLQFRQNSHNILPEYKNNRAELDSVAKSFELVRQNSDITVTGVYITGYASPEGSEAHNMALSEKRAKALGEYIHSHDAVSADMLHVDWKGEDWDGFICELGKISRLLKRDEVYATIERYPNEHDYCEEQLQKIVPPDIYHRLLTEIYPSLRRNEYRIEYNVRNFDIDEAKQQIKTRPDLLSVEEMSKVAATYGKDSDMYREVLLTAARTYPDNVAAVVNAARVEMECNNVDSAIRLLEGSQIEKTPEVLNALGVAYAKSGQYDKARKMLESAKAAGSVKAETNLKQVDGIMADL